MGSVFSFQKRISSKVMFSILDSSFDSRVTTCICLASRYASSLLHTDSVASSRMAAFTCSMEQPESSAIFFSGRLTVKRR